MKKYIIGLCLFLFAGLQAMTPVKQLRENVINTIQAQLQKQGVTDHSTLYEQKKSLGDIKSHIVGPDPYEEIYYSFADGSVLRHLHDNTKIYKDTSGNEILFDIEGQITKINPSDNYILTYAIQQAVSLASQSTSQAKQAYNDTLAVIQELLKQGASPQLQDIVLASQNKPLLTLLTQTAYTLSQAPLFDAIESGNIAQAHNIITKNPDILLSAVGPQARRPLTVALTKAAHARGCLLGATKASPSESAGSTNMVLMLLDTAATRQNITLLDDRARHILIRCSELTQELVRRTKNKRAIQEMQKLM